jgi:phosphate transport system substrate-binding protein
MAGLYTGQSDITVMGREATESEVKAFEWVFQYEPERVEIMTGSVDRAGKSPALVVFVHQNNPIDRLTMPQLEAVFAHGPGPTLTPIRMWSQLDIRDTCAGQPIRLYAPMAESGTGTFFRMKALGATNKMNWEHLTEFEDPVGQQSVDGSGRRILSALAADRCGMAVSNLQYAGPSVKPLALGASAGGPYYLPTRENIAGRKYPLARSVYAYVNRPAGGLDPQVKGFLEYVLSDAGQALIAKSGYLPLTDHVLRVERARLQRPD